MAKQPKKVVTYEGLEAYTGVLKTKLGGKVDKDGSKVLTDNNYSTPEKEKLANVAEGAQVNVVEVIKKNGVAVSVTDKSVDITVPTKTSEITNDSNYVNAEQLATKVDKAEGKTLSSNDYSDDEKAKLAGVATGAQVNILESVKVNNVAVDVTEKAVNIVVPTKVSEVANDRNYQTDTQVSAAIAAAVADITSFEYQKVEELPATGTKGVIYLKPVDGGTGQNIYEEFIWVTADGVNFAYEMMGTTEMDLSGYAQTADYVMMTAEEAEALWD